MLTSHGMACAFDRADTRHRESLGRPFESRVRTSDSALSDRIVSPLARTELGTCACTDSAIRVDSATRFNRRANAGGNGQAVDCSGGGARHHRSTTVGALVPAASARHANLPNDRKSAAPDRAASAAAGS
jgi:hypothetical protein